MSRGPDPAARRSPALTRRLGTLAPCAGSLVFQKSIAILISSHEVSLLREVVEHPGGVPSAQQIFTSLDNLLDPLHFPIVCLLMIDLRRHPRAPRPALVLRGDGGSAHPSSGPRFTSLFSHAESASIVFLPANLANATPVPPRLVPAGGAAIAGLGAVLLVVRSGRRHRRPRRHRPRRPGRTAPSPSSPPSAHAPQARFACAPERNDRRAGGSPARRRRQVCERSYFHTAPQTRGGFERPPLPTSLRTPSG